MGILDSYDSIQVELLSISAPAYPQSIWFRHPRVLRPRFLLLGFAPTPLPVPDFRQVLAVFIDVMLVLDQLDFDFKTLGYLSVDWQGIPYPLAIATRPHTQIPGIA
jgi:hypothetical protein